MGNMQEFANFVLFIGGVGSFIFVVLGRRKPDWSQEKRTAWSAAGAIAVFVVMAFVVGGLTVLTGG